MPDGQPSVLENLDEAVAPYFASVHVEMISIVQAFALYYLISQNAARVPFWADWDWAYFLRGLTVFLLAIALWHAYVTQLAYVATLHWLHTLFPFLFGVLQFMLANPLVLKPSVANGQNLYYFMLLMCITALTSALAYFNSWYQHRSNRTKARFTKFFGDDAEELYGFWKNVYIFLGFLMLAAFLLFLLLFVVAYWLYKPWEEIVLPLVTCLAAGLAIYFDPRFCATYHWAPKRVQEVYKAVYEGKAKLGPT